MSLSTPSDARFTQPESVCPHPPVCWYQDTPATINPTNGAGMERVGNIISPQWLADQMGLPVEEVAARIEQARKEDE